MVIEELPFAKNLASYIKQEYGNKKIIDAGCGPGMYVDEMRNLGLSATGFDIDDRLPEKNYLFKQSLFDVKEKADVVICLEVAEHIDGELNEQIVDSISNMLTPGGTLIWTAAQPGQGGDGHINCQPRDFWRKLFSKRLTPDDEKTEELLSYIKKGSYMGWFLNNLIVFVNR